MTRSHADLSDDPSAGFATDETAYELYYEARVTHAVSVTMDVQYIANPSGSRAIDDAVVSSLRFRVSF